ncbi:MAG: hypothetical protein ACE5EV_00475, partial [Gaiellales bacterium]
MRRILLAWLLALPLIAVGSQLAHWAAYRIAEQDAHARGEVLTTTGHGYLIALPVLVTVSLGLVVAIVLAIAADGFHGRSRLRIERWPFLLVPLVGFLSQEFVERAVAGAPASGSTIVEAPVLIGLFMQVPFAAAAYLIARALIGVATRVGRALAGPPASSCRVAVRAIRPHAGRPQPTCSYHL